MRQISTSQCVRICHNRFALPGLPADLDDRFETAGNVRILNFKTTPNPNRVGKEDI